MKLCFAVAICLFSCATAEEPTAPTAKTPAALEPYYLAIEPAALKSQLSKPMPGATQTILNPARESAEGLHLLTRDDFAAANLSWEEFLAKSKAAAARHLRTLKPELEKNKKGEVISARLLTESQLTSSVILCPEFFAQFSALFQSDLIVIIPNRSTVLIYPRAFGDFRAKGREIAALFADSTYPASSEAFEVSAEGIKSIGSFATESVEEDLTPIPESP